MSRKMICLALVALFVIAATAVYAEGITGLSFSAGAFRPNSSTTRDTLGTTWLDLGLGYKLPAASKLLPGFDTEIGVGYILAPGKTPVVRVAAPPDTDAWIIPATVTVRSAPVMGTKLYYGAGVGAYFTRVSNVSIAGSSSPTLFGYQLLGGYKVNKIVSVELGWTGIGKVQNQKLDGWNLSLVGKF